MKTMKKYSLLLLSFLLLVPTFSYAQDSRQRTTATIVADGLAQLPASKHQTYNQVMDELANTGSEGMQMILGMMVPADKGKNATFEYAVSGVVGYVTDATHNNLRAGVRKGLIAGLEKCTDNPNRAFILSQLQLCATAEDAPVFIKYLNDKYLSNFALRCLISVPGTDEAIVSLMKEGQVSKSALAYAAYCKKLKSETVEKILQSWLPGADDTTAAAVLNALSVCGSASSVKVMKAAAQKVNFTTDMTGATDAYLQLLNHLTADNAKVVDKAAKDLMKNDKAYIRGAGLQLLLKVEGEKANPYILSALKETNKQYRNAALDYASQYSGANIYDLVTAKLPSFSSEAQTDVINWLGAHHVASQMDAIVKAMSSSDNNLAVAAIQAAGLIGGTQALNALIAQLDGAHAQEVENALLAFHGNINDGVTKALSEGNPALQEKALKLAAARHMYTAYDKTVSLLNSDNNALKDAVYQALPGVVGASNFDALCNLLEKSDGTYTSKLQDAAKNALRNQPSDDQNRLVTAKMASSARPALYYPMLAQAGNADAIAKLKAGYNEPSMKDAAYQSLLAVDNPQMIGILYQMAVSNPSSNDAILGRYISLIKNNEALNAVRKYQLYRQAMEIRPSVKLQNDLLKALGETRTFSAFVYLSNYLDNKDTSLSAAAAVKNIAAKEGEMLQGETVKGMLKKAQNIYLIEKEKDPDAGYAVDELTGLLAKVKPEGFEKKTDAVVSCSAKKNYRSDKAYENVEMYLDWGTASQAVLNLRSMAMLTLGSDSISVVSVETKFHKTLAANAPGEWNTLYVKVVNDRIWAVSNGVTIAENAVLKNPVANKPVNASGWIELLCKKGTADMRDLYIHELPATPVFTLSEAEKKEGYEVLFDGRSLHKWQGNTTGYVPEDGNINVVAAYGSTGNLYTLKKYSDFIYRFEFCFLTEGVNNGIGIRTPMDVDAAYEGMEIQVLDHDAPIYKDLQPYQRHGSVYGVITPKHINFGPLGVWHKEEIRAIGDHITVTVDGDVVLDGNIREACQGHNVAPDGSKVNPFMLDHKNHPGLFNKDGYISFCGHGAVIKFRNVRILDLSKKKNK